MSHQSWVTPFCVIAFGLAPLSGASPGAEQDPVDQPITEAAPVYVMPGIGLSPYVDGQDPNHLSTVPLSQIQARMKIIAPYTMLIRSFGMQYGLENIPTVARAFKKKVAAGAWLSTDAVQNAREIGNLIAAAQAGKVDIAIVGSEVLLRGDLSEGQLLGYMSQVRLAVPPSVLVTTADTYSVLLAHPNVIAASDVVAANFYPYWEKVPIAKAVCSLRAQFKKLSAAAGGKQVIVSETGWPSDGDPQGAAVPSPTNAARFFREFVSWARANNVSYWYFDAFDESWKAAYEGPQGAHWGIWDKAGVMKAGMSTVFGGQTEPIDCTTCGAGTPSIAFTYIPPMGRAEQLEGQACHVDPTLVNVVFYINVAGNWWVKPYANATLTPVSADGSWSNWYVTGGIDELATQFIAFLIPSTYSPPAILGQPTLPAGLYQSALAWVLAPRSNNSISGTVTDVLGAPLAGTALTVSGADLRSTVTAASGKYSVVNVSASGTDAVTPALSGYGFQPSSRTVVLSGGNATANFTGVAGIELSVSGRFTPAVALPQGSITDTVIVNNAGAGPASGAHFTIALPSSVTLSSVSTSRGTCTASNPVVCDLGPLLPTQTATVTLQLVTTTIGRYPITATVSASEADSNTKNNTLRQTLTVDRPPVTVSVAPAVLSSAKGSPITLSATYSDPDGVGDLSTGHLYVGDTAATGLRVRYVAAKNLLYILNDAGTTWIGGCAPGAAQTIGNSRGFLDCAGTSVTYGGSLIVNWRLSPTSFAGTYKVWLNVTDNQGVSTNKAMGSWTITP